MKTRALSDGAILCALAVILSVICYYVPFLTLLFFFIPVPIVVLTQKHSLQVSLIACGSATLLLLFFIDPITAIVSGLYLMLVGCGLGLAYKKQQGGAVKVMAAFAGLFLIMMAVVAASGLLMGQNFIQLFVTQIGSMSTEVMGLYREAGVFSAEQLTQFETLLGNMTEMMKLSLPVSFFILPFFVGWANVSLTDTLLKRLRLPVKGLSPLSAWRVPSSLKGFIAILMLGLFIFQIGDFSAVPQIYTFTITAIIYTIFLIMGISFIFWLRFRKRKRESMGFKVLIVGITILIPMASNIVIFAGIMDIFLDLRGMVDRMSGEKK